MNISKILDLHEMALEKVEPYERKRFLYQDLSNAEGLRHRGIIGPRGVGKTVLLRQMAGVSDQALYISLDALPPESDLFELIRKLNADYQYSTFLLDEVHFRRDFAAFLKNAYDFLDINIMFTSSVALALQNAAYDLSRRVELFTLPPFSLREYVQLKYGKRTVQLSLTDVLDQNWNTEHMRIGQYFDEYLRGALMPFTMEEPDVCSVLSNILDKVVEKDIPSFTRLHVDELESIKKTIAFVGRSSVDGVNYSTISRNIGITKYKAEQYLGLLEKAFILKRIFPKGTNVLKEPKVLMSPPYRLLYGEYPDVIGGLREDYFAEAMSQAGIEIYYLKSTRGKKTPDFLVDRQGEKLVIEIGGKGKGREQFKGITADRKIILTHDDATDGLKRPLFMLGFL